MFFKTLNLNSGGVSIVGCWRAQCLYIQLFSSLLLRAALFSPTPVIELDEDGLSCALNAIFRMPTSQEDLEQLYTGLERSSIFTGASSSDLPHKRHRTSCYSNPFASNASFGLDPYTQYCCRRPMVVEIGSSCCCSCEECQLSHDC